MKIQIIETDFIQMEQRKRAHLINSVGGFKSGCLIGAVDLIGQTNLAIFSSIVHIGEDLFSRKLYAGRWLFRYRKSGNYNLFRA